MSERVHVLAQQLLGKPSIEECTLQEIKNLANSYPYSAPAQFLLLQKLKQENSLEYNSQLQKAVLYYHDPLQFEYFINSEKFYKELGQQEEITEQRTTTETIAEDNIEIEENINESVQSISTEHQVHEKLQPEENSTSELPIPNSELPTQSETQNINSEADLVFEPYHTVDYFASQGIKAVQEEAPKDKFGKQLKSFTEWLKTMKRLPSAEIQKKIDPATEKKVVHMADDSVHESEVVTEAMAEVWLKQGNTEKAIEIYNKLSLLNPSKKAFFAGKIENLKHS